MQETGPAGTCLDEVGVTGGGDGIEAKPAPTGALEANGRDIAASVRWAVGIGRAARAPEAGLLVGALDVCAGVPEPHPRGPGAQRGKRQQGAVPVPWQTA